MKNCNKEQYLGVILPLYEYEYDLGSYGYVGKSGTTIILIKKLELNTSEGDKSIKMLLEKIHKIYFDFIMNPFYEESLMDFKKGEEETNSLKKQFIDSFYNGHLNFVFFRQLQRRFCGNRILRCHDRSCGGQVPLRRAAGQVGLC